MSNERAGPWCVWRSWTTTRASLSRWSTGRPWTGARRSLRSTSTSPTEDAVAEALAGFEVVVAMRERTAFPASLLRRLPDLRLLVTTGMRNSSIDLPAAEELGITVCGTDSVASSTVEHTWALILAWSRHIVEESGDMSAGGGRPPWERPGRQDPRHRRPRPDRFSGRRGRQRLRDESGGVEPEPDDRAGRRCGRRAGRASTSCSRSPTCDRAPGPQRPHSSPDRGSRDRADATERPAREHLPGTGHRLRRSGRGGRLRRARRRRGGRVRRGAAGGGPPSALDTRVLATPHLGYVTREVYEVFYGQAVEDVVAFLDGSPVRRISP